MLMSSSGGQTVPSRKTRVKGPAGIRAAPQTSGWGNGEERVLLTLWCGQELQGSVTSERGAIKANR